MDFFEAQARAKKRTSHLVWLFTLAVAGTIAAAYFAAVFGLNVAQGSGRDRHRYNRYDDRLAITTPALWQPKVFVVVSLGTLLVVGLASLYKWNEYSAGGSAVAESVGARRVDPWTTNLSERRLLNVVEEMAIASGIPVPAVYLLEDEPGINAFAAGLTTSDAAVCVTSGTMQKLTRDELQGVIGHEFSHILNGDMRLNLRIAAIVFGILVLGLAGRGILWSLRGTRAPRGKNSGGVVVAIFAIGIALMIIGYVGYFFGRMIQAAVSRQREFLADASSVQFTRNPAGITGALKKIGGYALGSSLQSEHAAAIGHFFFAQGFTSAFGSIWATHPPLAERIRAIDPGFDGKMFEPPEVVDVAHESFVAAGLAPAPPAAPAPHRFQPVRPPDPAAAIAAVGTISPAQIATAQSLLATLPAALPAAARDPATAPALVYGLLIDRAGDQYDRLVALVAQHDGAAAATTLGRLQTPLSKLDPAARLPLLQVALPALRSLDSATLTRFVATLNELVQAGDGFTPFDFALQKMLMRSLQLGQSPGQAAAQFYSFRAVTGEISVVLSALAHVSSNVDLDSRAAFAAGAAQIKLIESQVSYLEETDCGFMQLDAALNKLALASLPIKQRTIVAAAHVVGADGQILLPEAELLRAVAAALDVPVPPLTEASSV